MRCGPDDFENVNRIMRNDSVYPFAVSSSGETSKTEYPVSKDFLGDSRAVILSPTPDMVFIFIPYSETLYQGHSAVLPCARGKQAIKHGKEACRWLFQNTTCQKIMGLTPVYLRNAILFSLMVGFKKEGLQKKSHLFKGELFDMVLFGMNK